MLTACKIDPGQVYDDGAVVLALNVSSSTLARARRDGTLRFARKGKRVFYLGEWLIDSLRGDASKEAGHTTK
jgi:hypothetical protein